MAETNEVEPLSDERLDMLEDDFQAGRGCFAGWGLALVAEVRALRYELLVAAEGNALHLSEFALQEAEIRRLRSLLQRAAYALSNSGAYLGFEHGVAGAVDAIECELRAGEPHEQREGGGP